MTDKHLKTLSFIGLALGALATSILLAYAGGNLISLWSGFTLWALSPYIILFLIIYFSKTRLVLSTMTAVSLICCLSTSLYIDSIFIHPDAQGALVFLFLPFYQLIVILFLSGISIGINFLRKKK